MNIIQAIILGVVEGFTEFLPISSTGHIILAEKLLGIQKTDTFFTVVIQFGAILAATWFFRSRLGEIGKACVGAIKDRKNYAKMTNDEKYGIWVLVSIIPTLIIGFLLRKKIDEWQNSTLIIIASTVFFGILFYLIERMHLGVKTIEKKEITIKQMIVMGLAQAISVIPGVSRSGSTIAGGITQKISMKDAVELSFIMGIPVILIATAYKLISNINGITYEMLFLTSVGTITSFVVGLWSIKLTLGILVKRGFFPFMIYRVGLGLLLTILYFNNIIK
jgi:undecaprenyl-diphosphatase